MRSAPPFGGVAGAPGAVQTTNIDDFWVPETRFFMIVLIRSWGYRCLRDRRPSQPYEFIGFGAKDVTKPYTFIWFGDIHGPKSYEFMILLTYLRLVTHFKFLIVGPDQKMVTKRP